MIEWMRDGEMEEGKKGLEHRKNRYSKARLLIAVFSFGKVCDRAIMQAIMISNACFGQD